MIWDAAQDVWAPVASGTTAKSKVTFDYSQYFAVELAPRPADHDGRRDLPDRAGLRDRLRRGQGADRNRARHHRAPAARDVQGLRRSTTTVEVYVDYWHFEEGYIASYASPRRVSTPWELLAAMDDVVFEKRQGAYTDTAAARFSVPWLSLVTESDARLVLRSISEFGPRELDSRRGVRHQRHVAGDRGGGDRPLRGVRRLVRGDEPAGDRQRAVQADPLRSAGPVRRARRVPAGRLPFTVEDFRFGDAADDLTIDPMTPPTIELGDEISVPVTVDGPGRRCRVQYTLVDPAAGDVLEPGGRGGEGGAFTVTIDPAISAALFPGLYQLFLLASSRDIAQVAQQRIDLEIGV